MLKQSAGSFSNLNRFIPVFGDFNSFLNAFHLYKGQPRFENANLALRQIQLHKPKPTSMKTKCLLLTALLMSSLNVFAQHPLIGTWEMVSLEFTDFDGKKISMTPATAREVKIITPT